MEAEILPSASTRARGRGVERVTLVGGMRVTPRFMGIFDLSHSISNWNFLDSEGGPPE